MSNEIIHSFILILTIILSFIFPKTNLVRYDLQISAGLFVLLFLSKKYFVPKFAKNQNDSPYSRLLESVIFTFVVLFVVNTTGGLESPFFFLIYFLLFSLALLLEPIISLTTTLTLIIFFIFGLPANQGFRQILPIISLAFLTPFALFLGKEYEEAQKSKFKAQNLQKDTFLFMSLMLKNHLKNIKTAVENFIGDHQLQEIKTSARKMEKLIEEFENKS
jgi:hypothetical protein